VGFRYNGVLNNKVNYSPITPLSLKKIFAKIPPKKSMFLRKFKNIKTPQNFFGHLKLMEEYSRRLL